MVFFIPSKNDALTVYIVQNPLKLANALHRAFQNAHRANQSRALKRLNTARFF